MLFVVLTLATFLFFNGCDSKLETSMEEPYFYQQWYLEKNKNFYDENSINNDAHIHPLNLLKSYTGKDIKIAIIDDGLDMKHEDLENALYKTYDVVSKSENVSHTNSTDFHGTSVTGIIGARVNLKGIRGIAPDSKLIFLKYNGNTISDSDTIELFNKAAAYGASIINNSWGTYAVSQAVEDTIVDLSQNGRDGKGIIFVFAAGNDDRDMENDESSIPEVISVGATNKYNLRASYSNHGSELDIVAPGGEYLGLTTLDNSFLNGVSTFDKNYILFNNSRQFIGTSGAAPIVSAIIALMLEKNPNLTRKEIENILTATADKIGDTPYENGKNIYYGYGKINLAKIMDAI